MKTKVMLAFSLLLLLVAKGTEGQTYGRATFNIRGITGYITFMPQPNNRMMIMSNISGTNANHHWHVHLLPVDGSLPPAMRCSNDLIGGHFDPLGAVVSLGSNYSMYCNPNNQSACEVGDLSGKVGPLTSGVRNYNETTGELVLFGVNGIIGRSIKIHGTEDVCATIVSSTELNGSPTITMLKAAFIYPVGGVVYMRQVMGESAVIFGKLYWVNNSSSTMNHPWSIRMNKPSQYYREGNCNNLGSVVSDLGSRHRTISISNAPQPYYAWSFFFQDPTLNLTDPANGGSLVINFNSSNNVLACAPLVQVETLSVAAINRFTASQSSRFASTLVTTGYSPSGLRVFSSAIAPNSLCKNEFSAGRPRIYNPHSAPPLDGSEGTPDRYPVGNFSIKYRRFSPSGSRVTELPIHGHETISGHSLGSMRMGSSGMTHSCSSLWPQYPSGAEVRMAKATFNSTVTGAIYFIQRRFGDGVLGMTHIMVDIWYTNPSMAQTSGHKWHIHERPPQEGVRCVDAIGGHFNPFNVDLNNNYLTECTPFAPLRCESGDLSGKHPKLNISAASPTRPTYTYVDNNLHLWGPANYSIIGRSIGLHSTAGPLFDCGPITEIVFSSRNRTIMFPYDANFDRTTFATQLTRNARTASPSDVLILDQEMTTDSSGNTGCVSATVRTVGGSTEDADDMLNSLEIPDSAGCTSSPPSSSALMLPSLFLILFSVLLVIAGAI